MENRNNDGTNFEQSRVDCPNETGDDNQARHFGYGRRRPGESSCGEKRVFDICFDYLNRLELSPDTLDGCFIDDASTAMQPFHGGVLDRPEAHKMRTLLRPGDNVLITDLAECFTSPGDMRAGLGLLTEPHGAVVHIVELNVVLPRDKDSSAYRFVEAMRATADRWSRETQSHDKLERSERRAAISHWRSKPKPGRVPIGYKKTRWKNQPWLDLDIDQVSIMQEIDRLRTAGATWRKIEDHIEECLAKHEGRPVVPRSAFKPRKWGIYRIRRAHKAWVGMKDAIAK